MRSISECDKCSYKNWDIDWRKSQEKNGKWWSIGKSQETYAMYSKSLKINVLSMSKPQAMISLAFSCANLLVSSGVRSFHKNFSSSVIWMTSGTLKTSCNHLEEIEIRIHFFVFSVDLTWSSWMAPSVLNASLLMMDHDQCTGKTVSFVHKYLVWFRDLYKEWMKAHRNEFTDQY